MKLLEIIDNLICKYIGFKEQKINKDSLKKEGNTFILRYTESFKRHTYCERLCEFSMQNFSKISTDTKRKLGMALGQSLAKNLIISFENISIKKDI